MVFVQFIDNLINKLFLSCVNLHGERFFREESEIFSAAANDHTTCWRDLGSGEDGLQEDWIFSRSSFDIGVW